MVNLKKTVLLAAAILVVSGVMLPAQTTVRRSYYVRADGDDGNNGRSEDAPFKTLDRAIRVAKMGVIKTITVIGSIGLRSDSLYDAGMDEILITGNPDTAAGDAAVLKGNGYGSFSMNIEKGSKFRFTHIRYEGSMHIESGSTVTLGEGVVATGSNNEGLFYVVDGGTLIMTGNAQITGNSAGAGVFGRNYQAPSGTIIMSGNAQITDNNEAGIRAVFVTMSDNAEISGNKGRGVDALQVTLSDNAKIINNDGGGVSGVDITLSGNATITGNTRWGVSVRKEWGRGSLTISGNATITGNTGSGVFVSSGQATMEGGTISGNKAEYGAGVYVSEGVFTQKGGIITGNEAEFVGGGVYVKRGATFNAQGGEVTGNTAGDGAGEDVFRQQ